MAGQRTGTPSIWKHAVKITRLKQTYGASDMAAKLGQPFADCITAVATCVAAVYAADDLPLQIDRHAPFGPEDQPPV